MCFAGALKESGGQGGGERGLYIFARTAHSRSNTPWWRIMAANAHGPKSVGGQNWRVFHALSEYLRKDLSPSG